MAGKAKLDSLSRRERQIMDIVYRMGAATAAEVMDRMPDPPGYGSVRKLLRILEEKGHVRHGQEGNRYVYYPRVSAEKARHSAVKHLVDTFFKGSAAGAVIALLNTAESGLSAEEGQQIAELIERTKREGR
jgi:predicted transcriptional regulator